ncbi:MAG TPA: radical SAM protein [Candidatus Deferrimicrobium sp.]|nr:radical SAM protein [Candidatus Deferrimicrobium sp.]
MKREELHLFSKFGMELAFEPKRANLFRVSPFIHQVLEHAEGKTVGQLVSRLADAYGEDFTRENVEKLIKAGLIRPEIEKDAGRTDPPRTEKKDLPGPVEETGMGKLILVMTNQCNLRCTYCLANNEKKDEKKDGKKDGNPHGGAHMSPAIAREAVDFFLQQMGDKKHAVISFYGGEPLLNFDCIKETVSYAGEKAGLLGKTVEYSVSTNGLLLTDSIIDYLVSHRFAIGLSLDGGRRVHDANRVFPDGSGSFDRVAGNLKKLIRENADVTIQTVISGAHLNLRQAVEELHALGVKNFRMNYCRLQGGEIEWASQFAVFKQNYDDLIEGIMINGGKGGKDCFSLLPLNFFTLFQQIEKKELQQNSCTGGMTQVVVGVNGDFWPCENCLGQAAFALGNLQTGFDRGIIPRLAEVGIGTSADCRQCWARYLCGGPCPLACYEKNHTFHEPEMTNCIMKRHFLETGLAVYAYFKSGSRNFIEKWTTRRMGHD